MVRIDYRQGQTGGWDLYWMAVIVFHQCVDETLSVPIEVSIWNMSAHFLRCFVLGSPVKGAFLTRFERWHILCNAGVSSLFFDVCQ